MPFSSYLDKKREDCRALVQALSGHFRFVSVLGTDVSASVVRVNRKSSAVQDGRGECGFVVKMHDGRSFFEYSLDDIGGEGFHLRSGRNYRRRPAGRSASYRPPGQRPPHCPCRAGNKRSRLPIRYC